ncbi:hypothetical protein [Streptomyces sp. NPDC085596]|uniref:hypothetical protein n=1 Tax=Streptomyces sp. NPDC085596 TaxID=3365731 RepID=UPI0037D45008
MTKAVPCARTARFRTVSVHHDFLAAEIVLLKRLHVLVFVEHGPPGALTAR